MDDFPAAQPGRLIEQARDRLGISQNEAAERAGMSGTRWRQIVKGDAGPMTSRRGVATLARMARVVGARHEDLDTAGREDVAEALRKILADEQLAEFEAGQVPTAVAIAELRQEVSALRAEAAHLREEVKALKEREASEDPPTQVQSDLDAG